MQQWAYFTIDLKQNTPNQGRGYPSDHERMAEAGSAGWELVAVNDRVLYFKRQVVAQHSASGVAEASSSKARLPAGTQVVQK